MKNVKEKSMCVEEFLYFGVISNFVEFNNTEHATVDQLAIIAACQHILPADKISAHHANLSVRIESRPTTWDLERKLL